MALIASSGCDQLGNPTTRKAQTGWQGWTNGVDATASNAITVSMSEARELLRTIPREQLDHLDGRGQQDEFFTLITVRPRWGRPVVPAAVQLVTQLDFGGGRIMRRVWRARAAQTEWVAGFVVPTPPVAVATTIEL